MQNQKHSDRLTDDIADIEESIYELHLRMWDMTSRYQRSGTTRLERIAGMVIEQMDQRLVDIYRQAAELRRLNEV